MSNEVTRPDGQAVSISFTAGLPDAFDGPCIFLMADGSIHAGQVVRNSKIFCGGGLSTSNPVGGFHEIFEIPLGQVVGWADAGPRDDRVSLPKSAVQKSQ